MAAVAPLIGGWLVGTVGWPAIFYINLPLALGAILLALRFVDREPQAGAGRTDYAGALLATGGFGGLTYALTYGRRPRQLHRRGDDRAGGGLVLLAGFLFAEYRRGDRAMMPLDLFGRRCFSGLNLLTFLLYGAFCCGDAADPLRADHQRRLFASAGGLAMLPLPILMTSISPTMGKFAAGWARASR